MSMWAAGATGLAGGAIGYLLGKGSGGEATPTPPAGHQAITNLLQLYYTPIGKTKAMLSLKPFRIMKWDTGEITASYLCLRGPTEIEALFEVTDLITNDGLTWWYFELSKLGSGAIDLNHGTQSYSMSQSVFEVVSPGYLEYMLPRARSGYP